MKRSEQMLARQAFSVSSRFCDGVTKTGGQLLLSDPNLMHKVHKTIRIAEGNYKRQTPFESAGLSFLGKKFFTLNDAYACTGFHYTGGIEMTKGERHLTDELSQIDCVCMPIPPVRADQIQSVFPHMFRTSNFPKLCVQNPADRWRIIRRDLLLSQDDQTVGDAFEDLIPPNFEVMTLSECVFSAILYWLREGSLLYPEGIHVTSDVENEFHASFSTEVEKDNLQINICTINLSEVTPVRIPTSC